MSTNCGIQFDFNHCSKLLEHFKDLSDLPFTEMDQLESGSIANKDENRMVGHYWLRNPDRAPNSKIKQNILDSWEQIESLALGLRSGKIKSDSQKKYRDILWVGIGGSALGPQLLVDAFCTGESRFHFFDNTDSQGIFRKLSELDSLEHSLVVIVSKSGGTREPNNILHILRHCFESKGLKLAKNSVAITQPGSALEKLAIKEGWLATLPVWDWVGGRTSIWSAVGLFPLALMGLDFRQFLKGADKVDSVTRKHCWKTNPAAKLALILYASKKNSKTRDLVVLPYRDSLSLFGRYLQQLVMESVGKSHTRAGELVEEGIAVYGNKGSTDQHAFVQQLRDGKRDFLAVFIEVRKDHYQIPAFLDKSTVAESLQLDSSTLIDDHLFGFLHGTRMALREEGRENLLISLDSLDLHSLGGLAAFFERMVGFYASLVDVNAYNQPGVEAGKKSAEEIINLQIELLKFLNSQSSPVTINQINKKFLGWNCAEVVPALLARLSENKRIIKEGDKFLRL